MTDFDREIESLRDSSRPILSKVFGSEIDSNLIKQALQKYDGNKFRKRKIARDSVVWLLIAMAIWRDLSIAVVARHIGMAQPGQGKPSKLADSSISKSRERVDYRALHTLFIDTAKHWYSEVAAQEVLFHGMKLFSCDGTTLSVVDTEANRKQFGGPNNQHGDSGYPKIRLVVMMATSSHLVVDAAFAGYSGKGTGEKTLAKGMAQKLPENSLLLFDAGLFNGAELWIHHNAGSNRHWLGRIKIDQTYKVIKKFGPGDELALVTFTNKARKKYPQLPKTMKVRVLTGTDEQGEPIRWMSSLLDPEIYSSQELFDLYSERWEVELGYRESKVYMLNRTKPLRSQKPDGVRQELWGILLAYNLIRFRMAKAASRVGLEGRRLSFTKSLVPLMGFCMGMLWFTPVKNLESSLADLDEVLSALVLPPRRKRSFYPRRVKAHPKRYPIKKPEQKSQKITSKEA